MIHGFFQKVGTFARGIWKSIRAFAVNRKDTLLFIFLAVACLAVNLPYLRSTFVPRHDTMGTFENFYFFYNEFYFHNILAQWMPYGAYGAPAAPSLISSLTPIDYVLMLLGKLFMVRDVLFVFKLGVFIEQLFFLLGLYLLCRQWFSRRLTAFLLCLAMLVSFEWFNQVFLNFRIYSFLPWVFYFLTLFFERRRAIFFWAAGVTGVIWGIGNCVYFVFLWAFILAVAMAVLFLKTPGAWRDLRPRNWWDGAALFSFLFLSLAYLSFVKTSFDGVILLSRPPDGVTDLEVFLTHGWTPTAGVLFSSFSFGRPIHLLQGSAIDNTLFVGMIPVAFFIWAVLFVRNKYFLSVLAAAAALIWLSFGGLLSAMAYQFPGLKYYRHIGLVFALVKTLLVICSGFGIEDFWKSSWPERCKKGLFVLLAWFLFADFLPDARQSVMYLLDKATYAEFWKAHNMEHVVFRMAAYTMVFAAWSLFWAASAGYCRFRRSTAFTSLMRIATATAFILIASVDVISFQRALYLEAPALSETARKSLGAFRVNELKFLGERSSEVPSGRPQDALTVERDLEAENVGKYVSRFSFVQIDPCNPDVKLEFVTSGVKLLSDAGVSDTWQYRRVVGCEEPKLRLVSQARFEGADAQAVRWLKNGSNIDLTAVLMNNGARGELDPPGYPALIKDGDLTVKRFNADHVEVAVNDVPENGAWLVYADAFHPGWRATVDGRRAALYRANLAFKAVFVPEGTHTVSFVFRPQPVSYLTGLIVVAGFAGGLFMVLALLAGAGLPLGYRFWKSAG